MYLWIKALHIMSVISWFAVLFYLPRLFVSLLIGYYIYTAVLRRKLEADQCDRSGKFFRMYNEIPTILMIIIVSLAVVKPF